MIRGLKLVANQCKPMDGASNLPIGDKPLAPERVSGFFTSNSSSAQAEGLAGDGKQQCPGLSYAGANSRHTQVSQPFVWRTSTPHRRAVMANPHPDSVRTLRLIDEATLKITCATSILYLLETQFEDAKHPPQCSNEHIAAVIYSAIQLIEQAYVTVNSINDPVKDAA